MTDRDEQAQRAREAMSDAIDAVPGDFDHPGFEALEAYVDGRLADADREAVESHVSICIQCAEDVADLASVRDSLAAPAPQPRRASWLVPAAASIAAALLLAVWIARQQPADQPAPVVAVAPPSPAAPVATPPAPDPLTVDERRIVDRVLAAGAIELPAAVRAMPAERGTLLGDSTAPQILPVAPVATAVSATRPAFQWQPVAGASAYSIAVFDDRFRQVAAASRIASTSWTPDADLPRDRDLAWQVTAHRSSGDVAGPAPPQPEARFRIVDAATAGQASERSARLANRPLELGILLAESGLLDEAREHLRKASADAATAARARTLLDSLTRR